MTVTQQFSECNNGIILILVNISENMEHTRLYSKYFGVIVDSVNL